MSSNYTIPTSQDVFSNTAVISCIYSELIPLTMKVLNSKGRTMRGAAIRRLATTGETNLKVAPGTDVKASHWMWDCLSDYLTSHKFLRTVAQEPAILDINTWTAPKHPAKAYLAIAFSNFVSDAWKKMKRINDKIVSVDVTIDTESNPNLEAYMNTTDTNISAAYSTILNYMSTLEGKDLKVVQAMMVGSVVKKPWTQLNMSMKTYYRRREKHIAAITTLLEN